MDPHPLANLFKKPTYVERIASELSALDYLYGVLLEMRESEDRDEETYEVIHEGLCIGSMLDLDVIFTCFMIVSLCFNSCLLCEHH